MAYVETLFNKNFLNYASYVIKDRAIPHIDDGLKPVQRRILHSLFEMDDGKFHKSANVIGHCMKYHPHGDASIFSALVLLANKDLFIEKQGNFGNIFTGDGASAPRYIECRTLAFAKHILHNPDLTTYVPSYDGRNREPLIFPAKIPVILIQGTEGIAVGMSTKILPHNIVEVLQAVKSKLRGRKVDLYPDLPTGGLLDVSNYEDGMGTVLVRAKIDSSDPKRLVIRELPFGSNTESLIASIENAARKGKFKIGSINDYTTEKVEIEIQLPRGIYTHDLLDALFTFTNCEQCIKVNFLVIRNGLPTTMTISEVIAYHATQLQTILEKELELELSKLLDNLHARTLELIFIEEKIYKDIEIMDSAEKIRNAVHAGFELFLKTMHRKISTEDIERLLKIPIRRISLYDINKARNEMHEIKKAIELCRNRMKDIIGYAEGFLDKIINEIADNLPRRSNLCNFTKMEARAVALRSLKLCHDEKTGYVGTSINGKFLFEVSEFDKILIIKRDGSYSVYPVSEKQFFGKTIVNIVRADKKNLSETIHTIIYLNEKKQTYLKRCRIEKFILGKKYTLLSEKDKFMAYTNKPEGSIILNYKPRPRIKTLEEEFAIQEYLVKGTEARGIRLSSKTITKLRIKSSRKSRA